MAQIYESLKSLIDHNKIAHAASTLGESESKVKSAAGVILPALLAKIIKAGHDKHTHEVVEEAGKMHILSKVGELFQGHGIDDGKNIGERMENALLSPTSETFNAAIAAKSGIKREHADRLTNWVAGAIAGFLGDKVVHGKQSFASLITELEHEKGALGAAIPADLHSKLGLASMFPAAKAAAKGAATTHGTPHKKKSFGWIIWLIVLLLLLCLLFFWWRSCEHKKLEGVAKAETEKIEEHVHTGNPNVLDITLPDGAVIHVSKGGAEERMVEFLASGGYEKAKSDKELENTWYSFDHIDFEHNSATQMTPGSRAQLDNVIAIIKAWPEVKMKVGGFADKTGGIEINDEISEARALDIRSIFDSHGISEARVSTVGFGKTYAKLPADAPDAQRALDRHIAVRFVK